MRIAFVLFDGLTLLDFVGVYDPLSRLRSLGFLPDLTWDLCADRPSVTDSFGLSVRVDRVRPNLEEYDMVVVPGGFGTRTLLHDTDYLGWLATAASVEYLVSVCTGSLLLGKAGLLTDRVATTHFNEYETLRPFCRRVATERIVVDGRVITAGAVASSLDLGLYLCEVLAGAGARERVRRSMDYKEIPFSVVVV